MAASAMRRIGVILSTKSSGRITLPYSSSCLFYSSRAASPKEIHRSTSTGEDKEDDFAFDEIVAATSGISRPLSETLREINKRVPDAFIKIRSEDGFDVKYVPWHIVNRILNVHAPEWSGEVRSIVYSPDGKSVSVVYRVTLYGTDAEIFRESTGTAPMDGKGGYGDPLQKAEAMAFRRASARLGLGLHLYHEDML